MDVAYAPRFQRSARLVSHLTRASELAEWIRQQAVDVAWIAPAQRDTLVRLAHYSTRIEGNPLTLPEVEALAGGHDIPVERHARQEILNYFSALRWIWRTRTSPRIDEKSLLQLHRLLTRGVIPPPECGAYKSKPNAVYQGGKIVYKPPPPEAASILTRALLRWVNSPDARSEHPAVAAAVAHHRLVSIHPFADGNGRAARALESWILYRRGFDTHHIFALDEYFESDRRRYYDAIQEARGKHYDLTQWLEYVAEGIVETLRKTTSRIRELRVGRPGQRVVLNRAQERILQALGRTPRIGGGDLGRSLKLSRSHMSKLMRPLLRSGLVVKEGATKSAVYRLGPRTGSAGTE